MESNIYIYYGNEKFSQFKKKIIDVAYCNWYITKLVSVKSHKNGTT